MEESLTVSVAIGSEVDIHSPEPAPLQDDSVLLEDCDGEWRKDEGGEEVVGGASYGERGSEKDDDTEMPERLQRFYFESDALILKNNIE